MLATVDFYHENVKSIYVWLNFDEKTFEQMYWSGYGEDYKLKPSNWCIFIELRRYKSVSFDEERWLQNNDVSLPWKSI